MDLPVEKTDDWQRVSQHIERMGIKQSKLASHIEVSDATISLYLKGDRKLSSEKEIKLLAFLNLSVK